MTPATPNPDPLNCALFLVSALSIAGLFHAAWLRSSWSKPFTYPIDFGVTFRGKRLLGGNKQWRGLMAMPVAGAVVFAALARVRDALPAWLDAGMWTLTVWEYAWVGSIAGLAFMVAELPNSFLKRRLNVPPGAAPRAPVLAALCFLLDRMDSVLGVLVALSFLVPVPAATWLWSLLLGGFMHWLFSVLLYTLKLKARPL